jgi:hypothetical protein
LLPKRQLTAAATSNAALHIQGPEGEYLIGAKADDDVRHPNHFVRDRAGDEQLGLREPRSMPPHK